MKQLMQSIRSVIEYLEALCGKKNFGFFATVITLVGVVLFHVEMNFIAWPVTFIGCVSVLVYHWKRRDAPSVLLFFGVLLAMLCSL